MGSGSWGTALALLLHDNKHDVTLWSYSVEEVKRINADGQNKEFLPGIDIPKDMNITEGMEEAAESDIFVLASPSQHVRGVLKSLVPYLKGSKDFVNAAKGIEEGSLLRMTEVMAQELPKGCGISILSGPSHAEEVSKKIPSAVVISSLDDQLARKMQNIFMAPTFRVYTNPDVTGVELGGAIKNVIALAAGISDGLGYGDNSKAALMTRGIVEIARLGVSLGAKPETFSGLAGIGDLIVTCTSMHSRNRRAGILLGKGNKLEEALKEIHMVVEGVATAHSTYELSKKVNVNMPITTEIFNVVFNGKNPKDAVNDLMTRTKREEQDFLLG